MPLFIDVKIISHFDVLAAYLKFIIAKLLIFERKFFFSMSTMLCKIKESKFRRNLPKLCDISKKVNFRRYFNAPMVHISLKFRANVRNFTWLFVPRTTKFRLKFRLGKRNFAQQFIWGVKFHGTFRLLE